MVIIVVALIDVLFGASQQSLCSGGGGSIVVVCLVWLVADVVKALCESGDALIVPGTTQAGAWGKSSFSAQAESLETGKGSMGVGS